MSVKIERSFFNDRVRSRTLILVMGSILCFYALPAFAYIGPGAGISFLGSIVSTLVVIVLAIGAILFWPIRYMWRRMRRQKNVAQETEAMTQSDD